MGNAMVIGDSDLKWSHDPAMLVPTNSSDLLDYLRVPVADRQQLKDVRTSTIDRSLTNHPPQTLTMHQLGPDDRWELVLLATGEYVVRRAMAVLTGARCAELRPSRCEGRTGSQTNYNTLASELPQVILVLALSP